MRHNVDWLHAGLPSEHVWEKLFYLVGDREKVYSAQVQAVSQRANRLMPSIQVQIIPVAQHITVLAQPELFNTSLLRFFQESENQ